MGTASTHGDGQAPFMLALPDLDGDISAASPSVQALASAFHLETLQLRPDFDGSYDALVSYLASYLSATLSNAPPERPLYLLGEGFGALLAMSLARSVPHLVDRLVLVNPATSARPADLVRLELLLALPLAGPLRDAAVKLALAPGATGDPARLAAEMLADPARTARLLLGGGGATPSSVMEDASSDLASPSASALDQLERVTRRLSPPALRRRLALLRQGLAALGHGPAGNEGGEAERVEQRTVVVLGGRDLVMPSREEGTALAKRLPRAFAKVLPSSGHSLLSDRNVDLLSLMHREGFLVTRRRFTSPPGRRVASPGAARDGGSNSSSSGASTPSHEAAAAAAGFGTAAAAVEFPSRQDVERYTADSLNPLLRVLCSPVFLSTMPDGTIVRGLAGIPKDQRPLLLVGNHQTLAQDMSVLVEELILEHGMMVRGLAHPQLFTPLRQSASTSTPPAPFPPSPASVIQALLDVAREGGNGGAPFATPSVREVARAMGLADMTGPASMANMYRTFGAVEVNASNFFRLLRRGEAVLLYPGGVREAFKLKREQYELFWPTKPEFVRMAAKHSATVVPVSAIGWEDCFSLLADTDELRNSDGWVGEWARGVVESSRPARVGVSAEAGVKDPWLPPIPAPALPARFYFLFGRPVHLTPALNHDRAECQRVYDGIKGQVDGGITYLLRKREQDPYKDLVPRLLWENPPLAPRRQAPTFSL